MVKRKRNFEGQITEMDRYRNALRSTRISRFNVRQIGSRERCKSFNTTFCGLGLASTRSHTVFRSHVLERGVRPGRRAPAFSLAKAPSDFKLQPIHPIEKILLRICGGRESGGDISFNHLTGLTIRRGLQALQVTDKFSRCAHFVPITSPLLRGSFWRSLRTGP